jgi:hypothetical protein
MRLQNGQNIPRIQAGEAEVRIAGMAGFKRRTVEPDAGAKAEQSADKPIPEISDAPPVGVSRGAGHKPHCRAESGAKRNRQSARPQSLLLLAAIHKRFYLLLDLPADKEAAHPFRTVDLVRREARQVGAALGKIEGTSGEGVNGVGMEKCTGPVGAIGDGAERLDRANLVVDSHDGDQEDIVGEVCGDGVRIDGAGGVYRNKIGLEAESPRGIRRRQNRFVLDGADEKPAAALRRSRKQPQQGQVVGFGCAGCEYDFVGIYV